MGVTLTPEERLLVTAATPPGPQPAPMIDGAIRWARLVELASWHRLSPLLWRHLRGGTGDLVAPAEVLDDLQDEARTTTARNLNLQVELDRALAALADQEIPVMLLKGAALIESVYPQVGLRPMDDLDLLVPRPSLQRAHRAIEALGYEVSGDSLGRDDETRIGGHYHHYPLVNRDGTAWIELHHHVMMPSPAFDIRGYWDRAVPGAGPAAHFIPAPEDLLLHVAVHFSYDRIRGVGRCGLGQLADLAWIADRCQIDWDTVASRARVYGVHDRLFLALLALGRLFDDAVPPEVVASLQPPSYQPELSDLFLRHRVLADRPGLSLLGRPAARRLFVPAGDVLGSYARADEMATRSRARLQLRRCWALIRARSRAAPKPQDLIAHLRLRRWIRLLGS